MLAALGLLSALQPSSDTAHGIGGSRRLEALYTLRLGSRLSIATLAHASVMSVWLISFRSLQILFPHQTETDQRRQCRRSRRVDRQTAAHDSNRYANIEQPADDDRG